MSLMAGDLLPLMLRIENVSYSYGGRRGASDVTLRVEDGGALIALAGPNGSGKSTLLKLIARVLTPQRGEIVLDGRSDWTAKEYARRVGYLLDEIRLHGDNAELRDEVSELARKYGVVLVPTAVAVTASGAVVERLA